jgi:predicted house-cleaning noncanonical NTP pyrophosphatase (MazG superfamily)
MELHDVEGDGAYSREIH